MFTFVEYRVFKSVRMGAFLFTSGVVCDTKLFLEAVIVSFKDTFYTNFMLDKIMEKFIAN